MANLPEVSVFDVGVYQLETVDPVQGGVDGKSNASARNLANRTRYLKDQVDALGAPGAPSADIPLTQKGAVNGVATLDGGGKIPAGQLPALAITDTFPAVSQAAMLALTAERGDVCIRTDLNQSFILAADPATTLANWIEIGGSNDIPLTQKGANNGVAPLDAGGIIPAIHLPNMGSLSVRQTVLSGPVEGNGFAAFGGATGGTSVVAAGTIVATAANGANSQGEVNVTGGAVNPAWTGLNNNGTWGLFGDIAAGVLTPVNGCLPLPVYQAGGAYSTAAGQMTFNWSEMIGKVGNGGAAVQTNRVCVGEVVVAGGVVTSIVWYMLKGRYDGPWYSPLPGIGVHFDYTHNLGFRPMHASFQGLCTTADGPYFVDDVMDALWGTENAGPYTNPYFVRMTRVALVMNTGSRGAFLVSQNNGVPMNMTPTSWAYRFLAKRGW